MTCESCDTFGVEVAIHGPAQLRGIVDKLRALVAAGELVILPGKPQSNQPDFCDLNLESHQPDHIDYLFNCPSCRAQFRLAVELYHGRGGQWARVPS